MGIWPLLQVDHYSLLLRHSVGDGRSYRCTSIYCLTVIVTIFMLFQMDNYPLPHVEMHALTNGPLFTASHRQCRDGSSYKWRTIHCLTVTVRRWTQLQMQYYSLRHNDSAKMNALRNRTLSTIAHCQCGNNKWSYIRCLTVTVWKLESLSNGQLFTASHRHSGEVDVLRNRQLFRTPESECERWTLLQMDNYLLPYSESADMDALTNGLLFTVSQWQYEYGRS